MKRLASSIALLALSGMAAHAADIGQSTKAELKGNEGQMIGSATLTEAPNGVLMRLEVQGLTPGWHGLHFHEKGDCSKSDFTSAGGHVHTEASMVHGLLNPDANESGDLPNLYVGADNKGATEVFTTYVSLDGQGGRAALQDDDGSAIVIHASPDDHMTQPIGGAGARVACAVIGS
jgi:Cu-Zn family superoxide dismutase